MPQVANHGSQQGTSKRVQCPQCGMSVKLKNLKSHKTKTCKKRDMQARKKLKIKPPKEESVFAGFEEPPRRREITPRRVKAWWE
ncbi:MAG: hypothetical protein ABIG34_02450 [Candidatus Peregrinibacteria bacterium]